MNAIAGGSSGSKATAKSKSSSGMRDWCHQFDLSRPMDASALQASHLVGAHPYPLHNAFQQHITIYLISCSEGAMSAGTSPIDILFLSYLQACQGYQGSDALERLVTGAREFTEGLEPAAQPSGMLPSLSRCCTITASNPFKLLLGLKAPCMPE